MERLKFGLALENFTPAPKDPDPEAIVAYGQRGEELGYDSLWAWDHMFLGSGRPFPFLESLTTLTLLAAKTERVELGTGILVLPLRGAGRAGQDRGVDRDDLRRAADAGDGGRLV